MSKKRIFILTVTGHLAALVLLYLPFVFTAGQDVYAYLMPAFFNLLLVAASLIGAIVASVAPAWRTYAGGWWLGFGLLLLASFPVCFASIGMASAMR